MRLARLARRRRHDQSARHHGVQHPAARAPRPHQIRLHAARRRSRGVRGRGARDVAAGGQPGAGAPAERGDHRRHPARGRTDPAARRDRDPAARSGDRGGARQRGEESRSCSPSGSTISERRRAQRSADGTHRLCQRPLPPAAQRNGGGGGSRLSVRRRRLRGDQSAGRTRPRPRAPSRPAGTLARRPGHRSADDPTGAGERAVRDAAAEPARGRSPLSPDHAAPRRAIICSRSGPAPRW